MAVVLVPLRVLLGSSVSTERDPVMVPDVVDSSESESEFESELESVSVAEAAEELSSVIVVELSSVGVGSSVVVVSSSCLRINRPDPSRSGQAAEIVVKRSRKARSVLRRPWALIVDLGLSERGFRAFGCV